MTELFPFYKADDESLVYNPSANRKDSFQSIKCCTLPRLVERMTQSTSFDTYFASAFFLTFRDFTTPLEFLNLLSLRYNGPPSDGSKDNLRRFEIEVDVVRSNIITILRQFLGTLVADDYDNSAFTTSVIEFFNSLEEDIKNEMFLIYFKYKKLAKPPAPKPIQSNIISSAASTMRFSYSVSPRTQSPNSTNVLTGLLTNSNNGSNNSSSNSSSNNNNNNNNNSSNNNNNNNLQSSPSLENPRSSMKVGKGIMKLLQSSNSSNGLVANNSNLSSLNNSPINSNSGSPTSTMSSNTLTTGTNNNNNNNSNNNNSNGNTPNIISINNEDQEIQQEKPSFLPEVIAKELTIMEWELISALTINEFSHKTFKGNKAVNITNLTVWFNRISSWVSTKIISKETPEERATIIEAFISIAMFAKELKNYNCVMEILGSLHNSSISRLKNSWALVSQKSNDMFQILNQLMIPDTNFKNYRKQLSLVLPNEPCIPYLGLFLTDYTYLDESNPPIINNGMVNIERIYLIGTRVQEFFQLFTNCSYNFTSNPQVKDAILGEKVWDENETFRLSRIREEHTSSPASSHSVNSKENSGNHHGSSSSGGSNSSSSLSASAISSSRRKNFVGKYRMSFTGNDPLPSISSTLSERDWKIITTNSKTMTFKKGTVILSIGECNNNLYRVLSGRVKIEPFSLNLKSSSSMISSGDGADGMVKSQSESDISGNNSNDNNSGGSNNNSKRNSPASILMEEGIYIEEGDVFGEETFLYDRPMLTNIIVDSNECELVEIEKSFILQQLFPSEPILAATFYKHIAVVMAERLKNIYSNYTNLPGGSGNSSGTASSSGGYNSPNIPQRYDLRRRSTIYETPSSLDLLRDGNDTNFRTKFGLSNEEVIIKSYNCKHNNINGVIYLTKHHLCFEGKFLTLHKLKRTPFEQITKILPTDKNVLVIHTKQKVKKFTLKTLEDLNEINGLSGKIWKNHHGNNIINNIVGPTHTNANSSVTKTIASVSATASTPPTPSTPPRSPKVGRGESFSNITDIPTKDEWNQILKGTKPQIYKKGDVLITEGIEYQKIFQIIRGECSVVKSLDNNLNNNSNNNNLNNNNNNNLNNNNNNNNSANSNNNISSNIAKYLNNSNDSSSSSGLNNSNNDVNNNNNSNNNIIDPKNSVVISKLTPGSIFGEMSFLIPGGSSTSLVVTSDEVEVYILESYFLHIMLKSKTALAPKFYKYLACVLESRVRQYRQQPLY
ncbi:hypothetical protein CYY_002673 [Polysphondylium violaceum]|uniref:Ras guanine nucleotide exchange factor n=1 Tax=Polysphondylium violaceum TaxID=133409 RepID=A0A8J4PXR6_9MYCE|nr:hypothetical protein CYY_002673 [Polysphondylium violaceum]